jgi:hypothetical protein
MLMNPARWTGFHWGTGSQMASVEMMAGSLGDALVNVARGHGVGFNACTLDNLHISGTTIAFALRAELSTEHFQQSDRHLLVRFASLDPNTEYKIIVKGGHPVAVGGQELLSQGQWISVKPAK